MFGVTKKPKYIGIKFLHPHTSKSGGTRAPNHVQGDKKKTEITAIEILFCLQFQFLITHGNADPVVLRIFLYPSSWPMLYRTEVL